MEKNVLELSPPRAPSSQGSDIRVYHEWRPAIRSPQKSSWSGGFLNVRVEVWEVGSEEKEVRWSHNRRRRQKWTSKHTPERPRVQMPCVSKQYVCAVVSCFSRVQLLVTLWTVAHPAPLPMEIIQVRILEWFAMHSSRGSSRPRD